MQCWYVCDVWVFWKKLEEEWAELTHHMRHSLLHHLNFLVRIDSRLLIEWHSGWDILTNHCNITGNNSTALGCWTSHLGIVQSQRRRAHTTGRYRWIRKNTRCTTDGTEIKLFLFTNNNELMIPLIKCYTIKICYVEKAMKSNGKQINGWVNIATYLSYMVVTGVVSFSFVLLKLLYCDAADETFELFAYLLKQSKQNVVDRNSQ